MTLWIQKSLEVVDLLLKHPGSMLEKALLLTVSLLVGLLVLDKTGRVFGGERSGLWRPLLVLVVGIVAAVAALTALRIYLPAAGLGIAIGAVGVVSLALVAPLLCGLLRTSYPMSVLVWALTVAAVAAAILLIGAGFDAAMAGGHNAEKGRAHKRELESLMEKP